MSKRKYVIAGVAESKKVIQVLQLKEIDARGPCKECKKNPRVNGSSRCGVCIKKFKIAEFSRERFQRKVEEATQKKD